MATSKERSSGQNPRDTNKPRVDGLQLSADQLSESGELARHYWQFIATGRICDVCLTAQVMGEFDDDVVCGRDRRPRVFDGL